MNLSDLYSMLIVEVVCELHSLLARGGCRCGAARAVVDDLLAPLGRHAPVVGVGHPDVVAHGVDHVLDDVGVHLGAVQDLHGGVRVCFAKVTGGLE